MNKSIRDSILIDISLVVGGAIILSAIHFYVPLNLRQTATLTTADPTMETLISSSYVHLSDNHFFSSLVTYIASVTLTCILCHYLNRNSWFRCTFFGLTFIAPFFTSLFSLAILQLLFPTAVISTNGFSSVVAGFVGFLFVILYTFLRENHSHWTASYAVILVSAIAVVLVIYRYVAPFPVFEFSIIAVSVCISAVGLGNQFLQTNRSLRTLMKTRLVLTVALSFVIAGLCLAFVSALFPATPTAGTGTTNVYAHGVGVVLGAIFGLCGETRWFS